MQPYVSPAANHSSNLCCVRTSRTLLPINMSELLQGSCYLSRHTYKTHSISASAPLPPKSPLTTSPILETQCFLSAHGLYFRLIHLPISSHARSIILDIYPRTALPTFPLSISCKHGLSELFGNSALHLFFVNRSQGKKCQGLLPCAIS
jgi:hypothetical protein